MMYIVKIILTTLIITLLLPACTPVSRSGTVYSREEARRPQVVEFGEVVEVRSVQIEGTKSPVGTLGGGAIGVIGGSAVGGGRGAAIATVVGAIAGGLLGSSVEETATQQAGLEITVRLESGRTLAIVQAADDTFRKGERVRVLTGAETRVSH